MDIAALNVKIMFQKNETVVDSIGNHKAVWSDYFSCHATVSGEGGAEAAVAGQIVENAEKYPEKLLINLANNPEMIAFVADYKGNTRDYDKAELTEKEYVVGETIVPGTEKKSAAQLKKTEEVTA